MISASELRIGNYIEINAPIKDNIIRVSSYHIEDCMINSSFYDGIELTSKILEKCGWISNKMCCYLDLNKDIYLSLYRGGNFFLVIKNNDKDFDCEELFTKLNIKYLHQLQNLIYSLVGEELTFKH